MNCPQRSRTTEADAGRRVPPRPHDAGSGANETTDGLDASTEALRHAAEDTPSGALPTTQKRYRCLTAPTSHQKSKWQSMVKKKHGVIIETPMEARQAEPGPSILLLLVASVSVAVVAYGHRLVRVLPYLVSEYCLRRCIVPRDEMR